MTLKEYLDNHKISSLIDAARFLIYQVKIRVRISCVIFVEQEYPIKK
jgi:hypothetical protein